MKNQPEPTGTATTATADPPTGTTTDESPSGVKRQCGRCRHFFPADPTAHPRVQAGWWACQPCRDALFGAPTGR